MINLFDFFLIFAIGFLEKNEENDERF